MKREFDALASNCVPVRASCAPKSSGTELRIENNGNNCKNANSIRSNIDIDNDNNNKNGNNVKNNKNRNMSKDSDIVTCNTTYEESSGRPTGFVLIDRFGERFRT